MILTMTTHSIALTQLDKEITRKKSELLNRIEILEEALSEAKRYLAEGRIPNQAGIVQGRGAQIDRILGELSAMQGIREFWSMT